jgi:hypothetical protein
MRQPLQVANRSHVPERRCLKRSACKQRANLIVNLDRLPCLVLDSSTRGFRLRGSFNLKRGQVVEIILDEAPLNAVRCQVVWIGKAGSKQEAKSDWKPFKSQL